MKSLTLRGCGLLALTCCAFLGACGATNQGVHVSGDFEDLLTPLDNPTLSESELNNLGNVKVTHRVYSDPTMVGSRGRSALAFRRVLINESHRDYVDLPIYELENSEYLVPDGVMKTLLDLLDSKRFLADEMRNFRLTSKVATPEEMVSQIPNRIRISKYIAIEAKGTTYLIYRPRDISPTEDGRPFKLFNDCEALVMRAYNSQKLKAYKGTGDQNEGIFREFREQGGNR